MFKKLPVFVRVIIILFLIILVPGGIALAIGIGMDIKKIKMKYAKLQRWILRSRIKNSEGLSDDELETLVAERSERREAIQREREELRAKRNQPSWKEMMMSLNKEAIQKAREEKAESRMNSFKENHKAFRAARKEAE